MGVVDVPTMVLEPTHNKQNFVAKNEYEHLKKVIGNFMEQYWSELIVEFPHPLSTYFPSSLLQYNYDYSMLICLRL